MEPFSSVSARADLATPCLSGEAGLFCKMAVPLMCWMDSPIPRLFHDGTSWMDSPIPRLFHDGTGWMDSFIPRLFHDGNSWSSYSSVQSSFGNQKLLTVFYYSHPCSRLAQLTSLSMGTALNLVPRLLGGRAKHRAWQVCIRVGAARVRACNFNRSP